MKAYVKPELTKVEFVAETITGGVPGVGEGYGTPDEE